MNKKHLHCPPRVLTIAGSDSGGGAGIQADIKSISANGCFATSAITAITAQNTLGVNAVQGLPIEIIEGQIEAVLSDIGTDSIKIGMLHSVEVVKCVGRMIRKYGIKDVVLDPVMISTSGHKLIEEIAIETMCAELIPLARVITPNIPEAEVLSGQTVHTKDDMERVAKLIGDTYGCAVLLKGGHSINDANDLLYANGSYKWFSGKRINNPNTHGTGCTLSSAIASNLAKGYDLESSIQRAKDYISGALSAMLDLGQGSGPMNHAFALNGKYAEENRN